MACFYFAMTPSKIVWMNTKLSSHYVNRFHIEFFFHSLSLFNNSNSFLLSFFSVIFRVRNFISSDLYISLCGFSFPFFQFVHNPTFYIVSNFEQWIFTEVKRNDLALKHWKLQLNVTVWIIVFSNLCVCVRVRERKSSERIII